MYRTWMREEVSTSPRPWVWFPELNPPEFRSFCRKITLSKHIHSTHSSIDGRSQYSFDFGSRSGSSSGSLKELRLDETDEVESDTEIVFDGHRPMALRQPSAGWPAQKQMGPTLYDCHQNGMNTFTTSSQLQQPKTVGQQPMTPFWNDSAPKHKEYIISAPNSLSSSFGSSVLDMDVRSRSQEIIESLPLVEFCDQAPGIKQTPRWATTRCLWVSPSQYAGGDKKRKAEDRHPIENRVCERMGNWSI
jgi:hypothetical protein